MRPTRCAPLRLRRRAGLRRGAAPTGCTRGPPWWTMPAHGERMVTKKPKGLGRGLENLLGPQLPEPADASQLPSTLPLERLQP
ncbi:MAG: hypothetical protein ACKO6D_07100, partial [Rubrivivax sp.]